MRKLLALALVGVQALAWPSRAATDTQAAGQGTGTFTMRSGTTVVTCQAPLAVTFVVRSNTANVTEHGAPSANNPERCGLGPAGFQYQATNGQPAIVAPCVPDVPVTIGSPGYTLTQSGTTYTLRSSLRTCSGRLLVDLITVTVKPAQVVYLHSYTENGVELSRAAGTLTRTG